ncbi:hypothetical protein COU74_05115 [Candidatus Peregrinibacteria bacterium CG10_big_fil_rev_8_21_14_0_10_36_19]|nr:MAG: hypothetical protein COU74_05115 [Candidatus Peregrinibacteria bacterium CG10_big_fil_rev_8_21_14_0_10_36_19]
MSVKRLLFSILGSALVSAFLMNAAFADSKVLRVSTVNHDDFEAVKVKVAGQDFVHTVNEKCDFEYPDEKLYKSQVVSVRRKLQVDEGETFRIKAFLLNTGNTPWFSKKSNCDGPKMSLGTDLERDRDSELYSKDLEGWDGANRIFMDQLRVDPGEVASFTFYAKAPNRDDILKEYFTPVLEGIEWIDDSNFSVEVVSGDVNDSPLDIRRKLNYKSLSGYASDINLAGNREIYVDLSKQQLYAVLDDKIVRQFTISSGAYDTPTPIGDFKVTLKQEVRVGSKPPHYIMPKFMWFKSGGYGFHALPSLRTDGGAFWTEAVNHIGRPVSHGCIRLLPEDADFLFEFTTLEDTKVSIRRKQDQKVSELEKV